MFGAPDARRLRAHPPALRRRPPPRRLLLTPGPLRLPSLPDSAHLIPCPSWTTGRGCGTASAPSRRRATPSSLRDPTSRLPSAPALTPLSSKGGRGGMGASGLPGGVRPAPARDGGGGQQRALQGPLLLPHGSPHPRRGRPHQHLLSQGLPQHVPNSRRHGARQARISLLLESYTCPFLTRFSETPTSIQGRGRGGNVALSTSALQCEPDDGQCGISRTAAFRHRPARRPRLRRPAPEAAAATAHPQAAAAQGPPPASPPLHPADSPCPGPPPAREGAAAALPAQAPADPGGPRPRLHRRRLAAPLPRRPSRLAAWAFCGPLLLIVSRPCLRLFMMPSSV